MEVTCCSGYGRSVSQLSNPTTPLERSIAVDPRVLVLLLSGNVLFAAGLVVHAFLYNFYLRELELPPTVMGHQVAAMTLGGLIALFPAGLFIDRRGTRFVLLWGVVVTVVGLTLTALARSRMPILGAAFVIGAGAASCRVSWGPAIMRLTNVDNRSRVFAWNVALLIGSSAAWTFAIGWMRDRLPGALGLTATQLALVAGASVSALAALCYAPLPSTSRVQPAEAASLAPPSDGGIRAIIPVIAFWMLAAALVLPFFNIYFTDRFQLRVAQVGGIFAATQIVTAASLLAAGELARRVGARRMLFSWIALLTPALLVLAFDIPLWAAVAAYVAQGVVAPATNPLIDQLLLERAPADRQGIVASWRNAAAEAAGAVGASVGGWILTVSSFATLLQLAALVAAVAASMLVVAFRRVQHGMRVDAAPV